MLRSIASTVAVLLIVGSAAQAQFLPRPGASSGGAGTPGGSSAFGGIGSAPSAGGFSPYLNLTRGGNSAAVNYYGIVRPQMSFQNSIQSLQQQGQQGAGNGTEADDSTMPFMVVGTRARFLNTSGYFLNLGGSTMGTGAGAGSGQPGGAGGQNQFGSSSGGGLSSVATAATSGAGVYLGSGGQSGGRGGNRGGRR